MFQFLNPIWLFAAAAVAIPVAIHLWNIRPGKVLKVGSISLMDAASRKSSRSLKLLDIPLLIMRCLLLVVLALLLAAPLWQKRLQSTKVKGWVLIPKETLQEAYPKFKSRIDSLTNAGYEFHYFDRGFPKSDLKQILANAKDSIANASTKQVNYWGLINQLDTVVTPALPVYVFTPNQANYFKGQKPEVALNLHWQTYTAKDSTNTWIQGAWFNSNNTIRVVQGNSKPSGTTYTNADIKSGNSLYNVTINNGRATVSLKNGDQQQVVVDTTTLQIAVYADNNIDAGYLKASLQAVSQFTHRKISIKQYADANAIPAGQSWLFWLSEKSINNNTLQLSHNIFRYKKGKVISSDSWLNNGSIFSVALQQEQKIGLYKLIEANSTGDNIIWRDGFGHPVLDLQKDGQTSIYNFYSHFDPAWNDLVWSNEFPGWMMELIIENNAGSIAKYDKRVLDQQQIMPDIINETHTSAVKTAGFSNISNYFWLILALLFFAERWMANKTQTTNG